MQGNNSGFFEWVNKGIPENLNAKMLEDRVTDLEPNLNEMKNLDKILISRLQTMDNHLDACYNLIKILLEDDAVSFVVLVKK